MSNAEESVERRRGLGLFSMDDGTFICVDPTFARMHGYDPEELTGEHLDVVIAPESRVERSARGKDAKQNGHLTFESMHLRKDGSRFEALVSVVIAKDESGAPQCSALAVEDLSARAPAPAQVREERPAYDASLARQKYRLTEREIEVLRLVASGKTDKDIAKTLGRSPYTVHNHVRHILLKMGASSRTDATVRALREGLV